MAEWTSWEVKHHQYWIVCIELDLQRKNSHCVGWVDESPRGSGCAPSRWTRTLRDSGQRWRGLFLLMPSMEWIKKPKMEVWWWCRFCIKIKHFLYLDERHHPKPWQNKKMTLSKRLHHWNKHQIRICFLSTGYNSPHLECPRDSAFHIYIALIHCHCAHLLTIMPVLLSLSSSLLWKGGRGRKERQMDHRTCLIGHEEILSSWITGPKLLQ